MANHHGTAFWLAFLALCVTSFLSALELTSVSTALPTISHDLSLDTSFVWIGNAYSLASTAFFPLSGALAQMWGRKPVMIGSILCFTIGSALAGAAQNVGMIIFGRTVQGIGGGGILCLGDIIIADLVPLKERGLYVSILNVLWVVAAAVGPLIGGVLSGKASWRWLFYLNPPLCGLALILCIFFLRLRTLRLSWQEKFSKMDLFGNFLIIAGTASCILGLTWAGAKFPWASFQVLVPLILGWVTLIFAFVYEFRVAKEPTVPFQLLSNTTSLSGYLGNTFYGLISSTVIYYLPVYFQACKLASPFQSSLDTFGLAFTFAPSAVVSGVGAVVLSRYLPQNIVGWAITVVAMSLLSTLTADSSKTLWVVYQILAGVGLGVTVGGTHFAVLAPLPVQQSAYALAFFFFVRGFAQTWGITIGTTVIQNALVHRLPADFVTQLMQGQSSGSGTLAAADISYEAIAIIPTLSEPLRTNVRIAFAESLSELWKVMAGFAGLGFLSTILLMREIPMTTEVDEDWGLKEGKTGGPVGTQQEHQDVDTEARPTLIMLYESEKATREQAANGEQMVNEEEAGTSEKTEKQVLTSDSAEKIVR